MLDVLLYIGLGALAIWGLLHLRDKLEEWVRAKLQIREWLGGHLTAQRLLYLTEVHKRGLFRQAGGHAQMIGVKRDLFEVLGLGSLLVAHTKEARRVSKRRGVPLALALDMPSVMLKAPRYARRKLISRVSSVYASVLQIEGHRPEPEPEPDQKG